MGRARLRQRVVSLVPSVTETLSAWGHTPIACTRFCERPDLAHVGGTKTPDIAAIVALAPDLVVVDREENRRQDAEALRRADVAVLDLDVRSLGGLGRELRRLAAAVGYDGRVETVEEGASVTIMRAFVPIWRRPWMTIGADTYGSSLLAAIGVSNVGNELQGDYPTIELAEIRSLVPDVVLVPSEPYAFTAEHVRELEMIAPSVRVDGQDLFWWGARTPSAVVRLRRQLAD